MREGPARVPGVRGARRDGRLGGGALHWTILRLLALHRPLRCPGAFQAAQIKGIPSKFLYFPNEGHVDPLSFQKSFVEKIIPQCDECHFNTEVLDIRPHKIETNKGHYSFDYVIDCRGLGANKDLGSLRGVRGEVIKVQAPGVKISRPVRLMHPRYQIYVVPRPKDCYLIGATSLESEDFSPVSVRSALELLSALYSLNSSFSEARILEMNVQLICLKK